MIERDLAHLRFLSVAVSKGDFLNPDELEWVEKKKEELERICEGIDEMLATNARRMETC